MSDVTPGVTPAPSAPSPSPTPSAPSAPAAASPSSAPTTGGGGTPAPAPVVPKTMHEGFEQELARLAKAPAEPTTPDATSPGPDAPPETAAPPEGEAKPATKPKWIPYERHEQIIENARQKARAEVVSEVSQKLGWALQYQPEQVEASMRLTQKMAADPVAFVVNMLREVSSVPELKQRLVQHRAQASGPPPPDMVTNDGKHRFYSAEGLAKRDAWLAQRLMGQMEQRLQPFEQNLQQQQQVEREAHVRSVARSHLEEMEQRPLFREHAHEIIAAMEADGRVTVQSAYDRIVLPKLAALDKDREAKVRREEREATIRELREKAGAGSFNPGTQAPAPVGSAKLQPTADGFKEGFRREFARLGGRL